MPSLSISHPSLHFGTLLIEVHKTELFLFLDGLILSVACRRHLLRPLTITIDNSIRYKEMVSTEQLVDQVEKTVGMLWHAI
jgi:hypothetical protein